MNNITKRNLSLVLAVLSTAAFISVVIMKRMCSTEVEGYFWWLFIPSMLCMFFFSVSYRNFAQAVKEDKKYGIDK